MLVPNTDLTGTGAIIIIAVITNTIITIIIIITGINIMGITGNIREITGNHAGTTIITTTIITILMDLITITGITGPITMVIMVEAIFS